MTVENVIEVIENVAVDRRKAWFMQEIVPHPLLEETFQIEYSTEEERILAYADFYTNCHPQSSWIHLCKMLYEENEMTAARKAKTFIQPTG